MWGWPQEIFETLEIAGDIWDAPPLPKSLYGRRTFVRWRYNQIFWVLWETNFSYRWCFARFSYAIIHHFHVTSLSCYGYIVCAGQIVRVNPRDNSCKLHTILFLGHPSKCPPFPFRRLNLFRQGVGMEWRIRREEKGRGGYGEDSGQCNYCAGSTEDLG